MIKSKKNRINRFVDLLEVLKIISKKNIQPQDNPISGGRFMVLCEELRQIKSNVFDERYSEVKKIFEEKRDTIKISSFELMEHDFRENSHTNVLQYLFDSRYSGRMAVEILKSFLNAIDTVESKRIASLVENDSYRSERELPTGDGRIDLLIVDEESKFVVVIENKIFSGVVEKVKEGDFETSENQVVLTKTQLTNYKNYVFRKYPEFDSLFVLLSYSKQDIFDKDFILVDYEFLATVLKEIEGNDNILCDYRLLLDSLLKIRFDKITVLELGYKFLMGTSKRQPTLYELNTIKSVFYA